jgi:hypothetical protein
LSRSRMLWIGPAIPAVSARVVKDVVA